MDHVPATCYWRNMFLEIDMSGASCFRTILGRKHEFVRTVRIRFFGCGKELLLRSKRGDGVRVVQVPVMTMTNLMECEGGDDLEMTFEWHPPSHESMTFSVCLSLLKHLSSRVR